MFGGWRLNHQQCRFQQQKRSFNDQNRWKMRRVVWISQLRTSKIASAMDSWMMDGVIMIYIYIYMRVLYYISVYGFHIIYFTYCISGCKSQGATRARSYAQRMPMNTRTHTQRAATRSLMESVLELYGDDSIYQRLLTHHYLLLNMIIQFLTVYSQLKCLKLLVMNKKW